MSNLERRLERLENRSVSGRGAYGAGTSARGWQRHFHAHENARRGLHGLEPLSEMPYTEEDREEVERTLAHTIPAYRDEPGWQTEEARAFLDNWERRTKERTERNSNG